MLRAVEAKLYPTSAQAATLDGWLRQCCWLYNQALEHRKKAYSRRREMVGYNTQSSLLTGFRSRMPQLAGVPVRFCRDALRRVDRGVQAFFRRLKEGGKPGFPRFRPHTRYNSLECLEVGSYVRPDGHVMVPKLGLVRCRGGDRQIIGQQKLLRVIRRASGWRAQVVVDDGLAAPPKAAPQSAIGIDMGLQAFATLDNGEKVENPRFFRQGERKLRRLQRRLCRCERRSHNRRKAVRRVARQHERVGAQRKDFAHQLSRRLVNAYDLIAFENLNIKGLASGPLAKSVCDAAWRLFLFFVTYKAESAGRHAVAVDPRGTSQECPQCGEVVRKELRERVHACGCGLVIDRDEAAARVILSRALRVVGANACGGNGLCARSNPGVSRPDEAGSFDATTRHGTLP